ncbi:MAG: class I SAM-dependent methyltransferase [Victivallales bacterium]|nr:class I SAM-dependent methyltransferase [Victivallales bacterium]
MRSKWNAEDFEIPSVPGDHVFEDGYVLAARQGIPEFIEDYRISRVKDLIAPWICRHAERGGGGDEKDPASSFPLALDIVCGNGWYCLRLLGNWGFKGRIAGVDVSFAKTASFEKEASLRGLGSRILANVANAELLPFRDGVFDVVYATESIEHIENPGEALREACRVLKPDGELIVTTPSGPMHKFWKSVFFFPMMLKRLFLGRSSVARCPYDKPMSFRQLHTLAKNAGFKIVQYRKTIFLPHESYIKFFPQKAQCILLRCSLILEKLGRPAMFLALHHVVRMRKNR